MKPLMTEPKRYGDAPLAETAHDDTVSLPGVLERPATSRLLEQPFYTIPRPPIPGVTRWRIVPW